MEESVFMDIEQNGVIGESYENGNRVIYSFDNYLPSVEIIEKFPTLVVIKWVYDGRDCDGMPPKIDQESIYKFEAVLDELTDQGISFRAYARTGGNYREFVHYTSDQEKYLRFFNLALQNHKRYPIEIVFYIDPDWSDYRKLIAKFNKDN